MLGVINIFLDTDLSYTWRKASMIVAKAQGASPNQAHKIHQWIIEFVKEGKLPIIIQGQQSLKTKLLHRRSRRN
jgi:hypothetical protein